MAIESASAQFNREHKSLVDGAWKLIGHLQEIGDRIRSLDDTSYGHHDAFGLRGKSLASYLQSALSLAEDGLYLPAFAVVRSTFEHFHIDRLILLSQKGRIPVVDDAGEDAGYGISRYFAFSNTPWGFLLYRGEGKNRSERKFWGDTFSARALSRELLEEGLLSQSEKDMWEVHYSFLSRYAHPASSEQAEELFGSGHHSYSHYASELVLLYVCYFGAASLRDFGDMSRMPPKARIEGWDKVAHDVDDVARLIDYAWFPGQQLHERDRYNEALRRYGEVLDETGEDDLSITASSIEDAEVQYYKDPLQRLRDLHQSSYDVVGTYISPWEHG